MNITPELLTANGWEEIGYSRYTKSYQRNWFFKVNLADLDHPVVFLDGIELPASRTMEDLALLFALLGDTPDAELETLSLSDRHLDRCDRCGQFVRECDLVFDELADQNICHACERINELEARLRDTLVKMPVPPGLRRFAPSIDAAIAEEFGEVTGGLK